MTTFPEVYFAARQGANWNGVKWPAEIAAWGAKSPANKKMLEDAGDAGGNRGDIASAVALCRKIVDAVNSGT